MARSPPAASSSGTTCPFRAAPPRGWAPVTTPTRSAGSSEAIARFLGTGRFLVGQTVLVIVSIVLDVAGLVKHWDPCRSSCSNLAFSTQAAYAAPLILLAQNRQDDRDRPTSSATGRWRRGPRPTPSSSPASSPPSASRWPTWSTTEDLEDSLGRMAKLIADQVRESARCPRRRPTGRCRTATVTAGSGS